MVDAMMLWCIQNMFERANSFDSFSVDPKLVKKVELRMYDDLSWRHEKGHW